MCYLLVYFFFRDWVPVWITVTSGSLRVPWQPVAMTDINFPYCQLLYNHRDEAFCTQAAPMCVSFTGLFQSMEVCEFCRLKNMLKTTFWPRWVGKISSLAPHFLPLAIPDVSDSSLTPFCFCRVINNAKCLHY